VPAYCVVEVSVPLVHVGAVPEANAQPAGKADDCALVMPSNDWAYDPLVSEKGVAAVADGCHHVANAAARNIARRQRQGSLIAESFLF